MCQRILLFLTAVAAFGQTFEVASIRPAAPMSAELMRSGKMNVGMKTDAGRVTIGFFSLRDLIPIAFGVKPSDVVGPDWLAQQRFDIVATLPEGTTPEQVPGMLRALLEERFKLKAHREKKEQNVYTLEIGKGGHKMKEAGTSAPEEASKDGIAVGVGDEQVRINRGPGGALVTGGRNGTQRMTMGANGMMHIEADRVSMAALTQMFTPMLDRPVLDRTGLTGAFQIAMDLSMQDMMQAARAAGVVNPARTGAPAGALAASDPSGGSVFASIEQLGLKLEKGKAQVESVVVDSVEKDPTEN